MDIKTGPLKGEGERFLECRHYEDCLDVSAIKNWRSFNCESCDFYISVFKKTESQNEVKSMQTTSENKENTRICERCGEKPTIQPSSPLCANCIAAKRWQGGSKNKGPVKPRKKKTTIDKSKADKSQQDSNTAVTIEFGKHASILREVEKLAEEELRSIDLQVIYMLKNYLKSNPIRGPLEK